MVMSQPCVRKNYPVSALKMVGLIFAIRCPKETDRNSLQEAIHTKCDGRKLFSCEQSLVKVGVNGGLWVGDPDVDAITRLHRPIEAISFDSNKFGQNFVFR